MSSTLKKQALGSSKLAEIGKTVRRKLKKHPRIDIVSGGGLDLYFVQNFLTEDECAALIDLIDGDAFPSKLYEGTEKPGFRTSFSCNLDPHHMLVARIEGRICTLMGVDPRHGETLQGQRYDVGQQFKPHFDHFFPSQPYWEDERKGGGQRSWTAMIYLNEPESGGETNFPNAGMCVSPRSAMLMLWNNMDSIGAPNSLTLHEGAPVTKGRKYIVTKWFRERFWGVSGS